MLKKIVFILLASASFASLTACDLHPVKDKQQLCEQAKRQKIYNANEPTYDPHYIMKGQKDKLDETAASC